MATESGTGSGGGSGGIHVSVDISEQILTPTASSWTLDLDKFRLRQGRSSHTPSGSPPPPPSHHHCRDGSRLSLHRLLPTPRKQRKVSEYYKKQESLLEGYDEMETMAELGCFPGNATEDEMKQLAKSERMAIHISNIANMVLFAAKVFASTESKSLAVIASTLDSLLDLLSGFILWFTSHAMKKPNHYYYPIGKKRMQPVGIIVFASVMATLGLQILLESGRQIVAKVCFFHLSICRCVDKNFQIRVVVL
ncbi:hypothetical protein GH714_011426 [Hevea brasiliensis]|uniref:Cation efflux protein transmembrane domain-containing protein n=1 Tax=Hevea brasiliensis TaxID=3981 RepID=A0A6A6KBD5_HEVBR|nr:hypothetical protein GH714_011426 [Hevea brasiliensis]